MPTKVRMKTGVATLGAGYPEGSVQVISTNLATQWVKAGWCEKCAATDKSEPVDATRVALTKDDVKQIAELERAKKLAGRRETVRQRKAAKKATA